MRYILLSLTLLLLTSCRPIRYIPLTTQEQHHDTIRLVTIRHDSIHLHDSIHILQQTQGDTIRITTTKYQFRDRTKTIHDTIRQVTRDTIRQPIPITTTDTPTATTWRDKIATILRYLIILAIAIIIALAILHDITRNKD